MSPWLLDSRLSFHQLAQQKGKEQRKGFLTAQIPVLPGKMPNLVDIQGSVCSSLGAVWVRACPLRIGVHTEHPLQPHYAPTNLTESMILSNQSAV